MDLVAAKEITASRVARIILVTLLLIGGTVFGFIWKAYEKVNDEKKDLYAQAIDFERYKFKTELELITKYQKIEILKERLKSKEELLKIDSDKKLSLKKLAGSNNIENMKYSLELQEVKRIERVESKLMDLMHEFSSLGVDLNSNIYCASPEDEKLYNKAEAIYTQAYAVAQANGLKAKYNHFFFKNGKSVYSSCLKS